MVVKVIGVVIAIILAIIGILGLAAMVFLSILLGANQGKEQNNNKTSE